MIRHIDIVQWFRANRVAMLEARAASLAAEKGFVSYFNDAREWIQEYRSNSKKRKENKENERIEDSTISRVLYQDAASRDLLRRMKWKRVTWDDDADFDSFSNRVLSNDVLFRKIPAFSFMSFKIVKDPSDFTTNVRRELGTTFESGNLTSWICNEAKDVKKPMLFRPKPCQSPFSVNWTAGDASILDSVSPEEMLTFLRTTAPQLQALQVRLEEKNLKITEDLENARVRLGALRLKYNADQTCLWTDPARLTDEHYVNPDHLRMFLDGILRGATFYRYYLHGHQIRIVHPSLPYKVDLKNSEIHIPANFAEFHWLPFHTKAILFEAICDKFRAVWWFWFLLAVMIVGDLELF